MTDNGWEDLMGSLRSLRSMCAAFVVLFLAAVVLLPRDWRNVFRETAFDLVLSGKAREAFDLTRETPAMRDRYGRHMYGQTLLLPAFAAVFLGSTQLTPGRFNVWGTLLAFFVLEVIGAGHGQDERSDPPEGRVT